MSQRYVDTALARPRWRTTLDYRFAPNFQFGVEINPATGEFGPRGNLFLQRETINRPSVNIGTSSDRIGTPEGYQAYFVTFSKRLQGTPVAPYFSINYSGFDHGLNYPFGAAISLGGPWTLMPMYDGQRSHTMVTWSGRGTNVTLIWVWNRRFGLSVGHGF